MTNFNSPPLFHPRVEKKIRPPHLLFQPPTYKKSRPLHLHFGNSITANAITSHSWFGLASSTEQRPQYCFKSGGSWIFRKILIFPGNFTENFDFPGTNFRMTSFSVDLDKIGHLQLLLGKLFSSKVTNFERRPTSCT